jgi:hypothetical protein
VSTGGQMTIRYGFSVGIEGPTFEGRRVRVVEPQFALNWLIIPNTSRAANRARDGEGVQDRNVFDSTRTSVPQWNLDFEDISYFIPPGTPCSSLTVRMLSLLRSRTLPIVRPWGPARTRQSGNVSVLTRQVAVKS